MPASTSQRRTKPKVRRNSDVIPAFIVCTTAICTLDWLTLGLKYSHISPGGLFSGSTVDIVSNILNAVSLIVLLFAWSRNDDK